MTSHARCRIRRNHEQLSRAVACRGGRGQYDRASSQSHVGRTAAPSTHTWHRPMPRSLSVTDTREACIEAEHYIRNISGPSALVFEITGAAPETTRLI